MPIGIPKNGTNNGWFKKGHKSIKYWLGKRHLLKTRKKISYALKGNIPWMKGKKHTLEANEKNRQAHLGRTGERCGAWKGGKTQLRNLIMGTENYKQWRSGVFQRDNWICQTCGVRGCYLEAHHIKPISEVLEENNIKNREQGINCEELWKTDNGVTLCKECHNRTKGRPFKTIRSVIGGKF